MFTMHDTTMRFFEAMPLVFGLANYLVHLMTGARDMAFSRLNAFCFWMTALGGLFLYFSGPLDLIHKTPEWMLAHRSAGLCNGAVIEAYGLWRALAWAQSLELVCTAFYLPLQLYWLVRPPTFFTSHALFTHILVLLLMLILRGTPF